jgi:hypothetical protein
MQKLSEEVAVIGTIDVQEVTTVEKFSDVIDMSKYWDVMCVFIAGNQAADGTMVCRAVTCDSAGSNVVALKTASTVAAGTDNSQVIVEVSNEDLAGGTATTADRYIKFGYVSAGSGGYAGAVVLGRSKYGPSSDDDLSTVQEIEIDKD